MQLQLRERRFLAAKGCPWHTGLQVILTSHLHV